ncbi:phosphoribosylanthranilate isomerase [Halobacillus kuroshimensis]|uniref:N-(5'-phosphoribosyl)anthranilate isomerase n=1 Tax=Halobacillus kuroshimensis TaxID=302481 RepID=A0ABS3DXI7_9BACI|nr:MULTISPECIES: phosphoribosylanthranilate isomerase [Halobacillus]MBN8236035.1 phosphoribosylanthranilate isomerase [Halobacillus kuroshimensis]
MREPIVKLCGNQSLSDTAKTASSKASHLGFIFVKRTKRYVRPERVGRWIQKIRPRQKLVGVFIDPTIDELEEILHFVPLDVIQLHGNETVSQLLQIKEAFGLPVWKVIHHQDGGLEQMDVFKGVADGFIVDSKVEGASGGTGVRFDWEAVPAYRDAAFDQGVPCLIAGGIKPQNVGELLNYQPEGIDISSGIERENKKDIGNIQAIMKEVEANVASIS